jgi:cell division protein ZapB
MHPIIAGSGSKTPGLTQREESLYSIFMDSENFEQNTAPFTTGDFNDPSGTVVTDLAILAERVEQLVQRCEQLTRENQELRQQTTTLQAERDVLHDKNEQSRSRIEAMIVRLRDLEQAP